MKKYLSLLAAIVTLQQLNAQDITWQQRKSATEKVYALFSSYSALSGLKDVEKGEITDSSTVKFSSLFASDAQVYDDINDTDTTDAVYTNTNKPLAQYLRDVRSRFPKGLISKIGKASISLDQLSKKEASIVFERTVSATTPWGWSYQTKDTLKMKIAISNDYSAASIASITHVGGQLTCSNCITKPVLAAKKDEPKPVASKKEEPKTVVIKDDNPKPVAVKKVEEPKTVVIKDEPKTTATAVTCPNDEDCDGVPDFADKCPKVKGSASNNGCPETKSGGVGVEIALNVGFGGGSNNSGKIDLSNTKYDASGTVGSSTSKVAFKPGAGITADLNINLMFGEKRSVGIATGILYNANFALLTLPDYKVEYQARDREGASFRRILTARDIKEKISYTNLSIPVLFKYRTPVSSSKKIGFFLDLGPVISIVSSAKSKAESTNDFEAVYTTSGGTLGYSNTESSTDWLVTKAMVTKHFNTGGQYSSVNDYFDKQYNKGYYVGLDKTSSGSAGKVKYNIGGGGMLRTGLLCRLSEPVSLTVGVQCLILSNGHKQADSYKPIVAADDFKQSLSYNSFLNSGGSGLNVQYGLTLGLQIKIK
jgi:hypothetical protein